MKSFSIGLTALEVWLLVAFAVLALRLWLVLAA